METNKKKILQMVEEGTINAEEALVLLQNLNKETTSTPSPVEAQKQREEQQHQQTEQSAQQEERSKEEQFFNDVRSEVGEVGAQFMKFFQSAVDQVKQFDMTNPFDAKAKLNRHYPITEEVKRIEVELTNGSFTVQRATTDEGSIHVEAAFYNTADEEKAAQLLQREFSALVKGDTLRIVSDMKFAKTDIVLTIPFEAYDKLDVDVWNGAISITDFEAKQLKLLTRNGKVHFVDNVFDRAKIETLNGKVYVKQVRGTELEVETANGAIYVDGHLEEVEAESGNGAIAITTTNERARKVEAESLAGSVELYVPKQIGLEGKIETNIGKLTVDLPEADVSETTDTLLKREVRFDQAGDVTLKVKASTSAGAITVRHA